MKSSVLKRLLLVGLTIVGQKAFAQELFVYTEPASNMPTHSVGLRLNNWLMNETETGKLNYHFIPEAMWGVNKNLMVHLEGFFSNRDGGFEAEGAALYAKYRFYSNDEVFRHFRMAAFGRIVYNNSLIHQEEIETNGHNSGYELGWIGTQLLHKQAISATLSYEQASIYPNSETTAPAYPRTALNYSLSTGRLILPKSYKNYNQTNFNIMLEVLGQYIPESSKNYLDIAPAVQLIFNSQTRVDVGYRAQLYSDMKRTAPNGFLIRIEHVLFNALK